MKKKPIAQSYPRKPRKIEEAVPDGLTPEELEIARAAAESAPESYRQGSFLIMYMSEDKRAVAVDLNEKTAIHHLGDFAEISAIVTALQAVKSQNRLVYEDTFEELTDEEFLEEGLAALEEIMAIDEPTMPAISEVEDLFDTLRGSMLDELIKPPKKKP